MNTTVQLRVHRLDGTVEEVPFTVRRMFNAGWVGNDRAALQHHIDELAAIGVPPPAHVPTLFALGDYLLTTDGDIQVHGDQTSGEVEWVLLWRDGEILVTVGSDHTDRRLETHSLAKAKNMCQNVMAADVWPFEEVKDHFGDLELECTMVRDGKRELYQRAPAASILSPERWIDEIVERAGGITDGVAFFSGTIGTVGGLVVADGYEFALRDPVLDREIRHGYRCHVLTGAIEEY